MGTDYAPGMWAMTIPDRKSGCEVVGCCEVCNIRSDGVHVAVCFTDISRGCPKYEISLCIARSYGSM